MAVAVAVKVTVSSPTTDAATVFAPGAEPNVNVLLARPLASVVTVAADSAPPPAVTEKETAAPANGAPFWSLTSTTNGADKTAPTDAACPSPETFAKLWGVGAMAVAVAVKVTVPSPTTDDATVFTPGAEPNVNVLLARPLASVVAVAADSAPPPAVTEKETAAPANGAPF